MDLFFWIILLALFEGAMCEQLVLTIATLLEMRTNATSGECYAMGVFPCEHSRYCLRQFVHTNKFLCGGTNDYGFGLERTQ